MNGERNVLDAADQSPSPNAAERPSQESTPPPPPPPPPAREFAQANGQSGKRRKRKQRQAANNGLSVNSSSASGRQQKTPRARPEALEAEAGAAAASASLDRSDTCSLFTTTSEITSEDDAASIEFRLRQLVVEQEEILKLDDRYRSTPVLAHRSLHNRNNDQEQSNSGTRAGCVNQLESGSCALGTPLNVRAKSADDLWAVADGDIFNFEHSANFSSQVPDVFVIQVDNEQHELDDDKFDTDKEPPPSNNHHSDPRRARSVSIASGTPTAQRRRSAVEETQDSGDANLINSSGSMRRNVSSSFLPERGNLRTLNINRGAGADNEQASTGRNRSNTAGSMDKSALFGRGGGGGFDNGKAPADGGDQSMLNIRRSAWTLSDFDQTFNKSAIAEQQQKTSGNNSTGAGQQQKMQQYSAISDTPRGSTGSDRQSTSLLIKASKNALAGLNHNGPQPQDNSCTSSSFSPSIRYSERCFNLSAGDCSDRRPSFSHSIVSIPSSIDSYTQSKPLPFKRKHKPKFSASASGAMGDGDLKRSCLKSCLNFATISQYLPILEWLPKYKLNTFYSDLAAGLTVTALNISTSLSAAVVAETDFGAAFRASIVNTFVYAILCSSKHASFGSWSIMSQMLLLSVKRALNDEFILDQLNMGPSASWEPEEYEKWHMNIIIMYTFLIGLVQLICGALNLGNILSSFIPEALCSSMIAATAFTMAIGQLANMCGTSNKILWQIERNTTELWADLKNPPVDITDLFANTFRWVQQIILLAKHCDQINAACVIISIISVILLFLNQYVIQQQLQRLFKRKVLIPFEMVLLVIMIIVSFWLDLAGNYNVTTCGPISIKFGIPNIPNLRLIRELWYNSLATALISYTMVYIMAKSYSNKLNYEVNYNQELIACGAGNLIGGLFDALPATASFSRTAGQVEAGGQTQMVSIINCVLLVVLARLLGQYVSVLPLCVMSAALFFGFTKMMTRFTEVFMYWRVCKVDCAIWVVTFLAILAVDMVNGFIFGFIFSLITMLYRAQNRRCYMLGTIGSSDVYVPLVKYPMAQEIEGIKIFQFCGPIHYVCADLVERLLRQKTRVNVKEVSCYIAEQGVDKFNPRDLDMPTHIILDFSMISFIDSAGIHVIKKIIEDYQRINVTILLASLASHVATVVKSEPSLWNVHKQRFYITLADAVHCAARDRMRQNGTGVRGKMYA